MAATHKIDLICKVGHQGSGTILRANHFLPHVQLAYTGDYESAVEEYTGTGTHTWSNDATNLSDSVNFSDNPITKSSFNFDNTETIAIYVGRANAATAPTGTVTVSFTGLFGLTTDTPMELKEDAVFMLHNPGLNSIDSTGMSVDLAGTTGFKVTLIGVFSRD